MAPAVRPTSRAATPAGPRPREVRTRERSGPPSAPSPSAASGRALTWLPGRARGAAGGAEAPRTARAGAGTRGREDAARAAPTLPPESGVEHSASPSRANEEDSRGNSTTYLRARNDRASLPAPRAPVARQQLRRAGELGVGRSLGLPGLHPEGPHSPQAPGTHQAAGRRSAEATCPIGGRGGGPVPLRPFVPSHLSNKLPPPIPSTQSLSTNISCEIGSGNTKMGGCFVPRRT